MVSGSPIDENRLPILDFDLSTIFIGREQQLDLFQIYLDRWKRLMPALPTYTDTQLTSAPSPNNKIQGLVVLLYGRGGFGKSTLLKHYHDMALELDRNLTVSKIVDWEFAIEGKRSIFNPPPGHGIDADSYFRVLCEQLADALGKRGDQFNEYKKAVAAVEEARKLANGVLERLKQKDDDNFAWLRKVTSQEAVALIRTFAPAVNLIPGIDIVAKGAEEGLDQAMKIGASQAKHLHEKLRESMDHNKLSDYLTPALKLGSGLGHDLARFAKDFPLLIFFDTYEEIDEGDKLLRIVIGGAGIRVGWVIAGRDNMWAGSEQRKRTLDVEYGYKEIVPSDRGLAIDFNTGGIGAFTLSDIEEYFSLLGEKVKYEPPLPAITETDAVNILELTQGVPLAVKIAAGLYLERADLKIITEKPDGKYKVVDEMARRYLLHTRADQGERSRLYGLALLRRADEPAGIATALGLSPEQARTNYEAELSRLHRRYSFIFTEKAQPSLHQEVRHFLRLWLLENRRDPEIMGVNERLRDAHEAALKKLEERRQYRNLKERMEDDEWVGIYLDLTEQQFWLDPVEGVHYCLPFILAAAIYRRNANQEAATIGNFFEEQIKQPYRNWWRWAVQGLKGDSRYFVLPEGLAGLEKLAELVRQRCPTFPLSLPDYRTELEAALWWRLGKAYQGKDNNKALEWHEKALVRLGHEGELREATAEVCYSISNKLYKDKKHTESIPFLDRAIELKPDYPSAFNLRGIAFHYLKEYQQAIQDYDHALQLDPNFANAYNNRGIAYLWLKDAKQARADYYHSWELDPTDVNNGWMAEWVQMDKDHIGIETAERLEQIAAVDPQDVVAYICRGVALGLRNKLREGLSELDQAIPLEPDEPDAYFWKGMICAYLGRNSVAIEAIEKALEVELPPIMLTQLYWLERDRPDFFKEYAGPLLAKYGV